MVVIYHKPCGVVAEISEDYRFFLCLACGKIAPLKEEGQEIGARNFPASWVKNPTTTLPPLRG